MKQRVMRISFSIMLALMLVLGLVPGQDPKAYADNWVNWEELFAQSGWFDSDAASGDTDEEETEAAKEDKSKKDKKDESSKSGSQKNDSSKSDGKKTENSKKDEKKDSSEDEEIEVEEDGTYTSKEEVAAYINEFGHLPDNFITKKEAKKLGWVSSEGNLDEVAPGMSIGGDYFGNYEGQLPEKKGRDYYECDIDYEGGYRDSKRIIFSDDGLVYYTEDHYETFELLYGEE